MARIGAFYDTRKLYIDATGYDKTLSFEEWVENPDDLKAALLFVQFYNQIVLAWDKANTLDFIESEEGVTTILQYLQKNVEVIKNNPSRFTPAYIYKVAYNCLYCICHDRKCDKDRMSYETSSIVCYDGKELSLFDTMSDPKGDVIQSSESSEFEKEFWSVIEDAGMSAEKVMRYLLTNNEADLKALNCRCKRYKDDPLRDIEVSIESVDEIIEKLREKFLDMPADSECGKYIASLASQIA